MNELNLIYLWKPVFEVLILWFVIYHIILFFEGSRAVNVLRGIIILLVVFLIFHKLNFTVLDWVLTKLFGISILAFLIIFHPEIRQGLARLGRRYIFTPALREEELDVVLSEIAKAAENLSKEKLGALIVIEKSDTLSAYIESGNLIDARVSADLIQAVFTPNNPLHDGGLVIRNGRILAAGCLFPLSQNQELSRIFGTRHRAALGLSEETDALIIIVSEERRDISLVYRSRFYKDLGRDDLLSKLKEVIKLKKENE